MKEIKKFELIDFSVKEAPQLDEEIVEEEVEPIIETFADQNSLEEVGQSLDPLHQVNFIKITQEELDKLIAQTKEDAVNQYIADQPVVEEEERNDYQLLERIADLVEEIKDRVTVELDGLLEKLLELSYTIAGKVIDIELMSISKDDFVNLISHRIKNLNFHQDMKVEVKDEVLAEALKLHNIEVSVNSDMLAVDYKIVWCNGFFERKASDIATEIEGILIDQIKK